MKMTMKENAAALALQSLRALPGAGSTITVGGFDSGRAYRDGKHRIAFAVLPGGILMADVDRGLSGFWPCDCPEYSIYSMHVVIALYDEEGAPKPSACPEGMEWGDMAKAVTVLERLAKGELEPAAEESGTVEITRLPEVIFRSPAEANGQRHTPGKTGFECWQCKAIVPTPEGLGTGYGRMELEGEDRLVCYACCDARAKEELKDRSKPFDAYVSSGGGEITTWTGGLLMRIYQSTPCKLTRRSWAHGSSYSAIRARDVHGGHWFGRGSPGIAIRLRPCKA